VVGGGVGVVVRRVVGGSEGGAAMGAGGGGLGAGGGARPGGPEVWGLGREGGVGDLSTRGAGGVEHPMAGVV